MSERIRWARALQAIAQSGLAYTDNPFERERFAAVQSIAAEMAASVGGEDNAELHARFVEEYGYGTPKIDVRGVVLTDAGLLLVREIGETRWTLPGGWADVGQSPAQAVEKEVLEEAGVVVRAERLLAVYNRDFRGQTRFPAHAYKVYVQCAPLGGVPAGDRLETEAAGFFAASALPDLSVKTPAGHLERILRIAAAELHPEVD